MEFFHSNVDQIFFKPKPKIGDEQSCIILLWTREKKK